MKAVVAIALAVVALTGCQRGGSFGVPSFSAPPPPPPQVAPTTGPLVWGRLDCKRATTNPEIVAAFNADKTFCERSAGIQDGDGVTARLESCMGERGYRYRAKEEHDAYCARSARR